MVNLRDVPILPVYYLYYPFFPVVQVTKRTSPFVRNEYEGIISCERHTKVQVRGDKVMIFKIVGDETVTS